LIKTAKEVSETGLFMTNQGKRYEPTESRIQIRRRINRRWLLGLLALTAAMQLITAALTGHFLSACVNVFVITLLAVLLIRDMTLLSRVCGQVEQACRTRTDFLANISHEIRTPLNAIIGFGELLSETDLDDEQADYLDTVLFNSQNLLIMVNDILDFANLKTGSLRSHCVPASIPALLERIEKTYYPMAERRGLTFSVRADRDIPPVVVMDTMRLMQCLSNLINNALKFTCEGHVCLRLRTLEEGDRPWLQFDVEDTGIGIAPDQQTHIFEAFTQGDGSASRRYGGIGLGLTLARRLADLLGGRLTFKSTPGGGSIFSLIVPYQIYEGTSADCLESTLQHAV